MTGGTDITFSASDGRLTASKKTTVTISTIPPPVITQDPAANTVCAGQPDSFSVAATGTGALSYQWKKGDSTIAAATNPVFRIASVSVGDSGQYACVVSNAGGKTTSKTAKLTVNSLSTTPTGMASPASINFGDSTILSVSAGALGTGASWKWYTVSCGGTAAGTGASIKVSPAITTSYFVRAEGGCATTSCSPAIPLTVKFTVTFDSQGGSPVSAQTGVNYGTHATQPTAPRRTGYTFGGWYKESACTNAWTFATDIVTSNMTLYAKWTINSDTVTFNSNGGTAVSKQIVAYNSTATLPNPAPTKAGNIFSGWYSDASFANAFSFSTPIIASITLYAKWTPVFSVTYSGNGNTSGNIPTDTNLYTNGQIVTVLGNTGSLAKTGFAFAGWNTSAGGNETDRAAGSTFQMGSINVVLYAKWSPVYTITFDGQGATVGPNPATKNVVAPATTVGSLPTPPTKTSYTFAGWWTAKNGGGTAFNASTTVTASDTVYAKWIIADVDGNVYTEVTIGTQTWMVENLKTTRYNDGSAIPLVTDNIGWTTLSTPAYCWYNNDSITNKNIYGALYNWYTVNTGNLAPLGWHVPSDAEWSTLTTYLGGESVAGGKLKESGTVHWASPNAGAINSVGFSALPGGFRGDAQLGLTGNWWTANESDVSFAWSRTMTSDSVNVMRGGDRGPYPKQDGFSVRCIRD